MSLIRCLKSLSALAVCCVLAACAQDAGPPQQTAQTAVVKPAGSCQTPDGSLVEDSTVVHRCAIPGQTVTGCPQYLCQRCNGGTWSNEYSCPLR